MKKLFLLILFFINIGAFAQQNFEQGDTSEIRIEAAVNISSYNSFSLSLEKEFKYGRWYFGPRIELLNPFGDITYTPDTVTFVQNSQVRIRLIQVEWALNEKIRFGLAPTWMLGPLPRMGYYKTPTTFYANFRLPHNVDVAAELTTTREELFQITIRKNLLK